MTGRGVTVERHDSPLVSWEMASAPAARALGPHVLGYVGYRERSVATFRRLEVPSGEVHLIVSFGPAIRAPDPLVSFVAAPCTEHAVVESLREQHCLEIRLTPLGASRALGVPMGELAHRTVPLEDLLGRTGTELAERLHDRPGWPARFDLVDAFLAARMDRTRPPAPAVEHAWTRLTQTYGAVSVGTLAREVGSSRRHLVTTFREQAGLPPKAFARVLRFERATKLLRDPGGPSLCEIALECGYYDQAHLNRDFRAFAGRTPTDLLAARLPGRAGWRDA